MSGIFLKAKAKLLKKSIDFVNDTIKGALLADTYSPDLDTDEFWDDISAHEIAGTGYTADGETLTGKAVNEDAGNDLAAFDADDVTWSGASFTARYYVEYKSTGTPSTSDLISVRDFGSNKSPSGVDFTVKYNANGSIRIKDPA